MMSTTAQKIVSNIPGAILNVLQYYSFFQYPLTAEEIHANAPVQCTLTMVEEELEEMVANNTIYTFDSFYYTGKDIKQRVTRRKSGNQQALKEINRALAVGRFIYSFPFIRFVGVSGSLSKGYFDKNCDFDFFIITENNRLWIGRTMLHLFKKTTFLVGQQHKFCMNYFIDTSCMEIEEQNRFTAIELSSLMPAAGYATYQQLMSNNKWTNEYLPNGYKKFYAMPVAQNEQKNVVKKIAEGIINALNPVWLNKKMMQLTDNKWRKKWAKSNFPMEEYDIAFKTNLHISKNHPANYQQKVLAAINNFHE